MKKEPVNELINKGTGEVIQLFEGDSHRIIRAEQKDAIQKSLHNKELNKEIKEWNNHLGGFIFVLFKYGDMILKENPNITPEDITKLFYLATYVNYEGFLVYNNVVLVRSNIKTILDVSLNTFDIFFNKMKDIGIFIQDENKNIKINNKYFCKGELDKEIKQYYDYSRVYIKTIRFLYDNVPKRKHGQLGNYFKIIPYVHRQRSILCWNPDSNKDDLEYIRAKELQDILGMHRHTIKAFINELVSVKLKNGDSIISFIKNDPNDKNLPVIANPKVFYGGNFDLKEGKKEILKWFPTLSD